MNDDVDMVAIDIADLQDDRGLARTHDHRESLTQVADLDRISARVEDLGFVQSVTECGRGDDGFLRHVKLTCRHVASMPRKRNIRICRGVRDSPSRDVHSCRLQRQETGIHVLNRVTVEYAGCVGEVLSWNDESADYIRGRGDRYVGGSGIEPAWAQQVLEDIDLVAFEPDPKLRMGASRFIGFSVRCPTRAGGDRVPGCRR